MFELKIEADVDNNDLKFCSAKIFCCFCSDFTKVKRFGSLKKNGSKGSERWILSNFDTHLRTMHSKEIPISLATKRSKLGSKSETTLISMLTKKSKESIQTEAISRTSTSGEALARSCQERILLDEKKSSSVEKTIEAENIEISDLDIALQVADSH